MRTLGLFCACFLALCVGEIRASLFLYEPFNYPDGQLITNGTWFTHSGTTGQVNVVSGRVNLSQAEVEDVSRALTGGPFVTGQIFIRCTINLSTGPIGAGNYFLHLKNSGTNHNGLVYVLPSGTSGATYRLGIGNGTNITRIPTDLAVNTDQIIVIRYDCGTGAATLWINPSDEAATVNRADVTNPNPVVAMEAIALRQALTSGNGMGMVALDDLKVGTTFGDVQSGPSTPFFIEMEAEAAQLSAPMRLDTNFNEFPPPIYIRSPIRQTTNVSAATGSYFTTNKATWQFDLPQGGQGVVWCRVLVPSVVNDSLYAWANDGEKDVFAVGYNGTNSGPSSAWKWSVCNGLGVSGIGGAVSPRVFDFKPGLNTFTLRGRESNAAIDRIVVKSTHPPANDAFANASVIPGATNISVYNFDASREPGEPTHTAQAGGSLWWRWIAPANGRLTLRRSYDPELCVRLTIYKGANLQTLSRISDNDPSCSDDVGADVTRGTEYRIVAETSAGTAGRLEWTLDFQDLTPSNDTFQTAAEVFYSNGFPQEPSGDTRYASTEPGDVGYRSLWWRWVPFFGNSGLTIITLFPDTSFLGGRLAFFDQSGIPLGIERRDVVSGQVREIVVPLMAGRTYYIRVDSTDPNSFGYFSSFFNTLANNQSGTNNFFGGRRHIPAAPYRDEDSFLHAGTQDYEPDVGPSGATIWWTWRAPEDGAPGIATITGSLPTTIPELRVFRGYTTSSLAPVPAEEKTIGQTRELRFATEPGVDYQIALSGMRFSQSNALNVENEANYKFALNHSSLVIQPLETTQITNANETVTFSAPLLVQNLGNGQSGRLRLRVIARAGIATLGGNSPFPPPDKPLVTNLVNSAVSLLPGQAFILTVSNICPAPTTSSSDLKFGWGVFALLEEEFYGRWLVVDSPLLLVGKWPGVAGAGGPGGGVVRLDPYIGSGSSTLPVEFTSLTVQGTNGLTEGRTAPFYAIAGFKVGGVPSSMNVTNLSWSLSRTNDGFNITPNGIFTAGYVNSNQTMIVRAAASLAGALRAGTKFLTITNLPSPRLATYKRVGAALDINFTGVAGRRHQILSATNLAPPVLWTSVQSVIFTNGAYTYRSGNVGSNQQAYFQAAEILP